MATTDLVERPSDSADRLTRVAGRVLGLPRSVRRPVGAVLSRLPGPDAKLLGFVLSPDVRANPWALYRQLQESDPVHRTPFGAWLVTRHADIAALVRHRQVSVEEAKATA